ncbi:MAG: sensor histidine kinase [Planctomycetaceae bacterium]|nr:sensor histidine kinase [Planctomycetaceae bacterium]
MPRDGRISAFENAGVRVEFPEGDVGFVAERDLLWVRDRNPNEVFEENQVISVVKLESNSLGSASAYSYIRANLDPWCTIVSRIKDRAAGRRYSEAQIPVQGTVLRTQPDRAFLKVRFLDDSEPFGVEVVVRWNGIPTVDFPVYQSKKVSDCLIKDDRVRALIESVDESRFEIRVSITDLRRADEQGNRGRLAASVASFGDFSSGLRTMLNRFGVDSDYDVPLRQFDRPRQIGLDLPNLELRDALKCYLQKCGASVAVWDHSFTADTPQCDAVIVDADKSFSRSRFEILWQTWRTLQPTARLVALYSADVVIPDLDPPLAIQFQNARPYLAAVLRHGFANRQLHTVLDAVTGNVPDVWSQTTEQIPIDQAIAVMTRAAAEDVRHDDALQIILSQLGIAIGADTLVILRYDPLDEKAELLAHSGKPVYFDFARAFFARSPIRDVAEDGEAIHTGNAALEEPKFRHLFKLFAGTRSGFPFRSCIGVRLSTAGTAFRTPGHGPASHSDPATEVLFTFDSRENAFTSTHAQFVACAAACAAAAIRQERTRKYLEDQSGQTMIGQMSSLLLHELRMRTSAVSLWSKLLNDRIEKLHPKQSLSQELFDFLHECSSSLNRVSTGLHAVDELFLDLSVKGSRWFELNVVIDELLLVLRSLIHDIQAKVRVDYKWNGKVKADRGRVMQVISNLLQNALEQFSEARCQKPEILVTVDQCPTGRSGSLDGKPVIQIRVEDNGIGISSLHWSRIFEHNYSNKRLGSGLGLFVSRLLAERMDGELYIEESLRFYRTCFVFEFPQ